MIPWQADMISVEEDIEQDNNKSGYFVFEGSILKVTPKNDDVFIKIWANKDADISPLETKINELLESKRIIHVSPNEESLRLWSPLTFLRKFSEIKVGYLTKDDTYYYDDYVSSWLNMWFKENICPDNNSLFVERPESLLALPMNMKILENPYKEIAALYRKLTKKK